MLHYPEKKGIKLFLLFVACSVLNQHASVSLGPICSIVCAATLRQKLMIKPATSPSHNILIMIMIMIMITFKGRGSLSFGL